MQRHDVEATYLRHVPAGLKVTWKLNKTNKQSLFAIHPAILEPSTGSKIDLFIFLGQVG